MNNLSMAADGLLQAADHYDVQHLQVAIKLVKDAIKKKDEPVNK